jgi:hypothetical protein
MTEAPRSKESTGKTRRRRTPDGAAVAEAGRPPAGAAPRVRAQASTSRELDAQLNEIAKDLQRISAGVRASGALSGQRRRDLREQLKGAAAHIRRATAAARAEASGSPRGGRISAARADQLRKLRGEVRGLLEELNALAPAEAGDSEAAMPTIVLGSGSASLAATKTRRRPLARIAGAAALVVAAAVAGLLVGRSTGEDTTSSQPIVAASSPQPGDYERAVGAQLQELAAARSSALERLRHARGPSAQAAASRDLAAAYGQAADVIAATSTPASLKAVRRRLVDGLTRLAHGYRKLARGAAEQNASGYEEGRRAVDRAEGDLEHGLNRIQEAPG